MTHVFETKSLMDCINETKDMKGRNLLLGNGFSIMHNQNFNYSELMRTQGDESVLSKLSSGLKTVNFEAIMSKLHDAVKISIILDPQPNESYVKAYESVKKKFVRALSKIHPEKPNDDLMNPSKEFILNFSKIFTLSYDLILYWLIIEVRKDKKYARKFMDQLQEDGNDLGSRNIFYLHGALHLSTDRCGLTSKLVRKNEEKHLIHKINDRLADEKYPLFIMEGQSDLKMAAMRESSYLHNALKNLHSVGGCLFIHGCSFNENDNHIYDELLGNESLEKIYISYERNSKDETQDRVRKLAGNRQDVLRKIIFYDWVELVNIEGAVSALEKN